MVKYFKMMSGLALVLLVLPFSVIHAESDIDGHWAEDDIRQLVKDGVMEGYGENTYKPKQNITRAEFAKLMYETLELPDTEEEPPFTDLRPIWYVDSIASAAEQGLIEGFPSSGESKPFKPDLHISREDIAIMIQRAFDREDIELKPGSIDFKDADQIHPSAVDAVKKMTDIGVIKGRDDGSFDPKAKAERGGTAKMIVRMQDKLDDMSTPDKPENPEDPDKPVQPGDEADGITIAEYQHDFQDVVDKQAANYPKEDGGGQFTASSDSVGYYVNPNNFDKENKNYFQFLLLSYQEGPSAEELNNKVLNNKGVLHEQGQAFLEASQAHNINTIYLIAHALHETGNGESELANGVKVGLDKDENSQMVTDNNKDKLHDIKKTYNMFGVNATDNSPLKNGSEHAYDEGWFTPAAAIKGGASFITSNYIGKEQDTLYKMKWNPEKPTDHQYATHVKWATIQAKEIYNLYNESDLINGNLNLHFEVPKYQGQPDATEKPTGEDRFAISTKIAGTKAKVDGASVLNVRSYPKGNKIGTLSEGNIADIIGYNGGWYKMNAKDKTGWVSGDYLKFPKLKVVNVGDLNLRVRAKPNSKNSTEVRGFLEKGDTTIAHADKEFKYIVQKDEEDDKWYKIHYKGDVGWIHSDHAKEIK